MGSTRICRGRLADNQAAPFEGLQTTTQIARIQFQIRCELAGGWAFTMGQLIKHAHLSKGTRAVEQSPVQHPDLLGVKTIESAHHFYMLLQTTNSHSTYPHQNSGKR